MSSNIFSPNSQLGSSNNSKINKKNINNKNQNNSPTGNGGMAATLLIPKYSTCQSFDHVGQLLLSQSKRSSDNFKQ
jgi:hypothetical protein